MDNTGCHNLSEEFKKQLSNITVEYLAPNCTYVIQPCDAGIIRSFKSKYRNKLVKFMLNSYEKCVEELNVKQSIYFVREAWRNVSKNTIENCWKKT